MSMIDSDDFKKDPNIHNTIIHEFQDQLFRKSFIGAGNTRIIPDLSCRKLFVDTVMCYKDIWCVLFTGFSMTILSTVFDIEGWNGDGIEKGLWEFCRAGYAKYENGLIAKLQDITNKNQPIWICPEMKAKQLKINDVHLVTYDEKNVKSTLTFDWNTGWCQT
jgi:hypothetical protein